VAGDYPVPVWEAWDEALERTADKSRQWLGHRWPDAEVAVVRRTPVEAILYQARRVGADIIVVGSRGHGPVRRLLLGSVSRAVVRRTPCTTLVVKGRPRDPRRFVVGLDGSTNAQRAVEFVARLRPPRGGLVRLVEVVDILSLPSGGLMPARVRGALAGQLRTVNSQRLAGARRRLGAAARRLRRAGWRTRSVVRAGAPLRELLDLARHADVLVLGARGVSGVERALLGSVAEGALSHARLPVLIVR
jgi:nucleotide-binding universal stress UspA family protein